VNKPDGGLRPPNLLEELDQLNREIEDDYNWGTYKCGMAQSQADYDVSMKRLFGRLDELEEKLGRSKYLLGDHITEPDIRQVIRLSRRIVIYVSRKEIRVRIKIINL